MKLERITFGQRETCATGTQRRQISAQVRLSGLSLAGIKGMLQERKKENENSINDRRQ